MKLEYTGPVVANGPGASLYFGEDFLANPSFPFDPGSDAFRALFADNADIVVLVADDAPLEFPLDLTIHDPDEYQFTIDPATDDMTDENTNSDGSNPGGDVEQ